jgi:hypothetical protein
MERVLIAYFAALTPLGLQYKKGMRRASMR